MIKHYDNWYDLIWNEEDEKLYNELYYTYEVETIKELEEKMEARYQARAKVNRPKLYKGK